jgi:hypothetical protein
MKTNCKCADCGHCKRNHKRVTIRVWGWCLVRGCKCEAFI